MALTQVSSEGIKDAQVKTADILDANITTAKILDQNVTLAKLEHGDGTSDGKFLRSNNGADPTWVAISTADGTKMPLAGGTFTGNVLHGDDIKARFGASNELDVYHHNNNWSYIAHSGSGNLGIESVNDIVIRNTNGEVYIDCNENGAVELYYDGSKKIQTASHGLDILDNVVFDNGTNAGKDINWVEASNQLRFQDNVHATFGDGSDLRIYHDGSHNILFGVNGADLKIKDASNNSAIFDTSAGVELFYANSKKFETTSSGIVCWGDFRATGAIDMEDNEKIKLGTGDDLQIFHNGTKNWIEGHNGDIGIALNSGNEYSAEFKTNGAVELFYDNSKKFWTKSDGAEVEGTFDADRVDCNGLFHIQYGTSTNTNYMSSMSNNNGIMHLFRGDGLYIGDNMNTSNQAGGPNNQKIHLNTNGTVKVVDGSKFVAGNGDDLQIYHDAGSTESRVWHTNGSGWLNLRGDAIKLGSYTGTETYLTCSHNGPVELYHNNSKKFETTSNGSKVTGRLEVTGGLTDGIGRWDEFENGSTSPSLQVSGTDLNSSCQAWIRATADAGAPKLFIANTRSTSAGGHGAVLNGDELGGIYFAGSDGSEFVNGAAIQAYVHNTPGANDMPGSLYFSTTNDSSASLTLRQKITAYGEFRYNTASAGGYSETYTMYNHREANGWYFNQNSSNTYTGITCRHGRGLSGYTGYMFSFKRNDGTTVGTITIGASSTAYNTSSDYRLKENQVTIANASTKVKQLKPYEFNFKDDPDYKHLGFFAHEVQEVIPTGVVTGDKDEMAPETYYEDGDSLPSGKKVGDVKTYSSSEINAQSIDYGKLTPILTAALQEALAEIETLKTKVAALEAG